MPLSNSSTTSARNNGSNNGHGRGYSTYMPTSTPPPTAGQRDELDLGQIVRILGRRAGLFLGVAAVSFGGLTYQYLRRPPAYTGIADILVEPVNMSAVNLPVAAGNVRGAGLDYTSQIRVLRSPAVLDPIVAKVRQRYPTMSYALLVERLTIVKEGESKVLRIIYNDPDPEAAAFVLSQVVDGFLAYSIEDRQAELQRGLEFITEQLQERREEVAAIEGDLNVFQKQYDLVNLPATSESVTQRMNQLLSQQELLHIDLAAQRSLQANLSAQVGFDSSTAIRVANLNESPNYRALLAEFRQVEQTIATESARFQVETPIIEALDDRRQQLLPLLEAEAQRLLGTTLDADTLGFEGAVSLALMQQLVSTANQIQVLETQDVALTQGVDQLQSEIQRLADLSQVYQQISRELSVAEESLTSLLANRQSLRLQMAQEVSPWLPLTPTERLTVYRQSNLTRQLLFSTVLSLLLGGSAALLRDRLDQVFHDSEELARLTQLPNLALVPNTPGLKSQPLLMDPNLSSTMADVVAQSQDSDKFYGSFAFAEAFYSLDANLRLLSSDAPIQVVALTSSAPGEGKSTMCAHLAIAAANMGRRVLLIDSDLRKPTQHLLFGLSNRQGLSDLLTQATDLSAEMVQPLVGNANLHLLTAGTRPPAPGRLLSSRKMQQVTEQFRNRYDLVIFDTPPLAGMIDAKLTAANVDGLLLVVRLQKSQRAEVRRVLTDLGTTVQAPLLGVVVNGVPPRRHLDNYDYYYGYNNHDNQHRKTPELEESS